MIVGEVSVDGRAKLRLRLRSEAGAEATVTAMIDTGFDQFVALTPATAELLGLESVGASSVYFADGPAINA